MQETWKDVPSYEDYYQVSNFGNVRTKERTIINSKGIKCFYSSKTRKPCLSEYRLIALSKNNSVKVFKISRLVALLFVEGKTKDKKIVNHIDGNKYNDKFDNLEWSTSSENTLHAFNKKLNKSKNKIRGVFFEERRNKWAAYLYRNNKNIFIGRFLTENEALNAYNKKLDEYIKN